jgi:hypothetical protein
MAFKTAKPILPIVPKLDQANNSNENENTHSSTNASLKNFRQKNLLER